MKLLMLGSGSYKSSLTYFRLVALGQQLAKQHGYEVAILVPSADKYNNFTADKTAQLPHVKLLQPWQFTTKSATLNLLPYLLSATLRMFRYKADAIYLYKPTPITIIGLLPKLLFGTPVYLDLDDLGSEVMRLQKQPWLLVQLVAACERLALKYASAVIVTSTFLESMVSQRYPGKPVLVLSNGVNPDEFSMLQKATPRPALYYFGALNRINLVESFLQSLPAVVAAVPEVRVSILGGGSALAEAQHMVEQLGIQNNVLFSGWIAPEELSQHIAFADIAVCTQPDMPTTRAASNLKIFQYMALGSVLVVTNVGDLSTYVNYGHQAVGAVVEPNNRAALSTALINLLGNTSARTKMALAARQRAETTYSWQQLTAQLDKFLRQTTLLRPGKRKKIDSYVHPA